MIHKLDRHVDLLFDYHNPSDVAAERFSDIRLAAKVLARTIIKHGGHDRMRDIDRSIDKIREAVFYAIASIVIPKEEK